LLARLAPLWLLVTGAAAAEPRTELDGVWLTLGPVAAAARVEGEWHSAVGAELSVVRVVESALPAALGLCAGGVTYAGREGGRIWLEGELAIASPLPFPVGLAAGATAHLEPHDRLRVGAQATLWFLAGFVPFVRAGALEGPGAFVEVGVMLKIPVRRFP
jgi:hypothetical protein